MVGTVAPGVVVVVGLVGVKAKAEKVRKKRSHRRRGTEAWVRRLGSEE